MRDRVKSHRDSEEAILRRRARDYGYRMERYRKADDGWYLVSGFNHSLAIVAQNLSLEDVSEFLFMQSPLNGH
jgi:hypothetical protein